MKVCLLGCSGFIGYHLIKELLKNGHEVFGVDIVDDKIRDIDDESFTFFKGDISDLYGLETLIILSDVVINLAAICNPSKYNVNPVEVIDINYVKALDIINFCLKNNKHLIQFSTSEVYGKTVSSLTDDGRVCILKEEETPLILGDVKSQRWSYSCAKQMLERTIYAYGFEKGLKWTIVRPFNFLGKNMDYIDGVDGEGIPRVFCCFMKRLMENKPLQLVNGGKNQRCFTYIDDAISAILSILENLKDCDKQIFNIGNPENELSMKELADIMINNYNKYYVFNAGTIDVSGEEFYGEGYDDSDRRIPDISKITRITGWKPQFNIEDTVQKSLESFIKEYKDKV